MTKQAGTKYVQKKLNQVQIVAMNKKVFNGEYLVDLKSIAGIVFAERHHGKICEETIKLYPEIDLLFIVGDDRVTVAINREKQPTVTADDFCVLLGGHGGEEIGSFSIDTEDWLWFQRNHFNAIFNNAAHIEVPIISDTENIPKTITIIDENGNATTTEASN